MTNWLLAGFVAAVVLYVPMIIAYGIIELTKRKPKIHRKYDFRDRKKR